MPVTPDSFASKSTNPSGTSGTLTVPINVPVRDDQTALVGMLWFGEPNVSASTFGVTLGGAAMTEMDSEIWDTTDKLAMWGLADPAAGLQDAVLSFSGIPAGGMRCVGLVVGIYSGVGGVDTPVVATPSNTVSASVTVPSLGAAHRTVFLHGGRKHYTAYNQIKRASLRMKDSEGALWWWDSIAGELLLGDAAGDDEVISTATQANTSDNWHAIGVNLAPAPISISASVSVAPIETSASLSLYRVQEIDQSRTWKINAKAGRAPGWERDPQSVFDYTWDWADTLTGDDDIVSAVFTSSNSGLEILSSNHTTTTATVWVRGPASADVTCHMTTDGGREDERTAPITARPR